MTMMSYRPYKTFHYKSHALGVLGTFYSESALMQGVVDALTKFKEDMTNWKWLDPKSEEINIQFLRWNQWSIGYPKDDQTSIHLLRITEGNKHRFDLDNIGIYLKCGDKTISLPECNSWNWAQIIEYCKPIIVELIEEEIEQFKDNPSWATRETAHHCDDRP